MIDFFLKIRTSWDIIVLQSNLLVLENYNFTFFNFFLIKNYWLFIKQCDSIIHIKDLLGTYLLTHIPSLLSGSLPSVWPTLFLSFLAPPLHNLLLSLSVSLGPSICVFMFRVTTAHYLPITLLHKVNKLLFIKKLKWKDLLY